MSFNRILILLLAAGFFISFANPTQPQPKPKTSGEGFWASNLPKTAHRAWQGTVQIRNVVITKTENPMKDTKIASGVILKVDTVNRVVLVVTHLHCLSRKSNGEYRCRYEARFPGNLNKKSQATKYYLTSKISIVMSQPNKHLAYLKIKYPKKANPIVPTLKAIDNDKVSNMELTAIGFPCLLLRSKQNWNKSRPGNYKKILKRFSKGKLLAKGLSKNKVFLLMHTADSLNGNCGGPLIDQEGQIVGINCMIYFPDATKAKSKSKYCHCNGERCYYIAISSSEVLKDLDLIKKNNLW
jgi:hypothetical protein